MQRLDRPVEMFLPEAHDKDAVPRQENVNSQVAQFADITPIGVETATGNVLQQEAAAVEDGIAGEQNAPAVQLRPVARVMGAVPGNLNSMETQVPERKHLPVANSRVYAHRRELKIRRIDAGALGRLDFLEVRGVLPFDRVALSFGSENGTACTVLPPAAPPRVISMGMREHDRLDASGINSIIVQIRLDQFRLQPTAGIDEDSLIATRNRVDAAIVWTGEPKSAAADECDTFRKPHRVTRFDTWLPTLGRSTSASGGE